MKLCNAQAMPISIYQPLPVGMPRIAHNPTIRIPRMSIATALSAAVGPLNTRNKQKIKHSKITNSALLNIPIKDVKLLDSIESIFSKKPKVAEINKQAANYAYNYATAKFDKLNFPLDSVTKEPGTMLVQGHQGTAIGKMVSGCRFQPYYPITPASDESVYLESNEILAVNEDRPGSTVVVQTEDEISAIGMMIGGALTGTRSSTCTSGPGFSLMAEALGWGIQISGTIRNAGGHRSLL